MPKKIIILGAKGNLGTQLVKVFKKEYELVAWDKEEIDITDKELILKKVNDIQPDIIINTVAYNAVDKCEKDETEYELAKKIKGWVEQNEDLYEVKEIDNSLNKTNTE